MAALSGCRGSIGTGAALEMLLTGRQITAQEAYRLGLVNRVVPAADLMTEVRALANAAGEQAARRDALHHRRRPPRTADVVC